jgi:hypothetical protein
MRISTFLDSPYGLAVMQLFAFEQDNMELRTTLTQIRRVRDAVLYQVLVSAKKRNEFRQDTDIDMLAELFPAALMTRAMVRKTSIDLPYMERLVDFLLQPCWKTNKTSTKTLLKKQMKREG